MRSRHIQELVDAVEARHGAVQLYGSSPDEVHGTCFIIAGIPATFSVLSLDGKLVETYDIQVEGVSPGDYLYIDEVSLPEFMRLVSRYIENHEKWP